GDRYDVTFRPALSYKPRRDKLALLHVPFQNCSGDWRSNDCVRKLIASEREASLRLPKRPAKCRDLLCTRSRTNETIRVFRGTDLRGETLVPGFNVTQPRTRKDPFTYQRARSVSRDSGVCEIRRYPIHISAGSTDFFRTWAVFQLG